VSGPHGSAFSGRVGWGSSPAVVVVDLVRAYTEPDGPFGLPDAGPAVAATRQLIDAARAHGRLVVWTVVRYAPGLGDAGCSCTRCRRWPASSRTRPGIGAS
jgi:maleamate amidohydrolase